MKLEILEAALNYAENGISVIPLCGKKPAMTEAGRPYSWSRAQVQRAQLSHIHEWHRRGYLQNVGIVSGAVSGNLAVIDLDGDEAVSTFRDVFPELIQTHCVATGSGHGEHLYFYCDELPPTTRTKGYELRANGCYVVAPPSIHPDTGQPYRAYSGWPIARVDNLQRVVSWIRAMIQPEPVAKQQPAIGCVNRYGQSALSAEIGRLTRAKAGERNNALNVSAFRLGQLAAEGLLDRGPVESALLGAALALGLGEHESLRTIHSGFTAGLANPRSKRHAR